MSSLSFFPLIPAVTTASAAPVYHGGMIPCLGDVEPVNTRWLIKGYFPMGAVSVVAGPGGVGKGVFMADVVAAVTTGRPTMLFPDAAVAQGNVLVLTSEDDPGMSLAPRMIAAEADMRRVFYATPGWYWQQKKKKLVIGASLFELIDELHPALVIIDPLRSFLEGNAAANGDVMRRALDMLQEKALADQFSVVIVSHMVKKAGDDARMLLAGSGELWNAARSVTILGRLPMDESVTYVTQEKLNVGTKARSILFHTQTVGLKNKAGAEVETVRAVLAATTEKHYKELIADKPMPLEPSQQDAKESIMALLKEQGPMAAIDEARFSQVVGRLQESMAVPITGRVQDVVQLTAQSYGINAEEQEGILKYLIEGGDLSLYGLSNAVTRASQDVVSYDRATTLEGIGWQVATMEPQQWKQINQ